MEKLSEKAIEGILSQALEKIERDMSDDLLSAIAHLADGDARFALNALEVVLIREEEPTLEELREILGGGSRHYDKDKDRHYDVISAFIKSMRGSDPDAALLYLAVMLDGGEDPKFIARRLVIFASEDIGNADPTALTLAISGLHAVEAIGMPEARINLAHVTTYLASTVKSNAAYEAINSALNFVQERTTLEVPTHLRNQHPDGKNYKYPHAFEGGYVPQQYAPAGTPQFYHPKNVGTETKIKSRLESLSKK
jgi:putative ATPase